MREADYGRIVHIASNAFYAGTPNMGPYLAAKGGVVGLTRALATELGSYGITANAVSPGHHADRGGPRHAAQGLVRLRAGAPGDPPTRACRPTSPRAVAFLASEESGWVTGQVLVVDAGHIRD